VSAASIDLNCDLGEREDAAGIADDLELLGIVSSANVACGGHAGDERSMLRTVTAALARGVAIGAHPAYPDRVNFGRMRCDMAASELEDAVAAQVEAMLRIVERCGGKLSHVKPHGALYHAAMRERSVAEAVARGVGRVRGEVFLVGLAGAPALDVWRGLGFHVVAEAFADRRFEPGGSLRPRSKPDALIDNPAEAAAQAVAIATGEDVRDAEGGCLSVRAETICVHSDTFGAVRIARSVREALTRAGVRVEPPRR
jgi:UPF0271 protein